MCGDEEFESSDNSTDDDTASVDSFHSWRSENMTSKWAYSLLLCYSIAAIAFVTIFIYWFYKKLSEKPDADKDSQNQFDGE